VFARFFIDRPIFAWVLSIVIVLGGITCYFALPVTQYPEIAPPTVQVTCQYPGASAQVVVDTVAAPIEQQINGVESMLYMSSQSANDGSYNLTVTFALGTDLNMAQVLVQNRVQLATPSLPDVVKATGVNVKKRSPAILLVVNLYSEENPATGKPFFDQLFLSNYATIQLRDPLARINGVGDVNYLGQQDYSMRVWLNPDSLASRNLSSSDVMMVLREQNVQVAAGQIGQQPMPPGQQFQYTMTTMGRLTEPEQFGAIVLKTSIDGKVTYLRDVARVELGARNQDTQSTLDGRPSAGLAIYQLPGSNALAVADAIKDQMKELQRDFPKGLRYAIVYDTTPFIEESVQEVVKTLRDAVILVAIVVLLFLQDWKALVLPLIDVTVSLVGTLIVMKLLGFTLNNLTLFGLVLAIGIVVDDAIVVLENIERWIALGYPVREATIHAMDEITGPIIGITLVLSSVFLPSAFLGGISGEFYRQFALTIAASMIFSAINAMTMTPARATSIFKDPKPGESHHDHREALPRWGVALALGGVLAWLFAPEASTPSAWTILVALLSAGAVAGWLVSPVVNRVLGQFFKAFNVVFDKITAVYGRTVNWSLRLAVLVLAIYGGLLGLTWYGFTHVPTGFIPAQDKGYLLVNIQLPDAASLERTNAVMSQIHDIARETEGVDHIVGIHGMSIILNAVSSNYGSMFIVLKPFHDRHGPDTGSDMVAAKIRDRCFREVLDAMVSVFGPPPVDGLGNAGGFKLMVEARQAISLGELQAQADQLAQRANQQPGLVGVFNSFRSATPQFFIDIDRVKCKTLGVPLTEVFNALQVYMGGYYVNDFNEFNRTWQVNLQAEAAFRLSTETLRKLMVRNSSGSMVPLGTVVQVRDSTGPVLVNRYNTYPAATINGGSLPGVSTGTVITAMEKVAAATLGEGTRVEWTEIFYLQTMAGNTAAFAFIGAVTLVFLILAAQYESWSLPLAVILVVPMCLLCALAGVVIAQMDINIFVQIGLVVLVGLASKNAILIVEFARDRQKQGASLFDATVESARVRLRPIIMTSFAFILGVLPLVLTSGAGAEMRRTLGVAVFSGMLGVTLFGIYMTPVFYYVVRRFTGGQTATVKPDAVPAHPEQTA